MDKKLIDGIYKNTIACLLDGVNLENQQELIIAYKTYLFDMYASTLEPQDDINQVINIYSMMENKKWKNKTLEQKLSQIIRDKNLEKLREISNVGYKHAQRKLGCILSNIEYIPQITEEDIKKYIMEMQKLRKDVQKYNDLLADMYLSEGTLDFEYAMNLTENLSMRIGRMK